jgi:hypothetical protein
MTAELIGGVQLPPLVRNHSSHTYHHQLDSLFVDDRDLISYLFGELDHVSVFINLITALVLS